MSKNRGASAARKQHKDVRKSTGLNKKQQQKMDRQTAAFVKLTDVYFRLRFWQVRKKYVVRKRLKQLLYGSGK